MSEPQPPVYRSYAIDVPGGTLHVGHWGHQGPLVLASHGITANHREFVALSEQLQRLFGDRWQLVAPDHRGRGRSRDIRGPFGMRAHADDLRRLLDHLGAQRADALVGHSMGGFVAAVASATAPDRFPRPLLVDGGLPLVDTLPEGMTIEQLLHSIVGPMLDRLDMNFASLDDYLAFWRTQPAFGNAWSDYMLDYVRYDLVGEAPRLRASANKSALIADVQTQLVGDLIPDSLDALDMPLVFLRAARGVTDEAPLYSDEILNRWTRRLPRLRVVQVPAVNHVTIMFNPEGASAVARELHTLLTAPSNEAEEAPCP